MKKVIVLLVAVVLVVGLLVGCASNQAPPAASPAKPAPAQTTPQPAAATPAKAPIHIKWMAPFGQSNSATLASLWLIDRATKQSNGELVFDYKGGPEAIPTQEQGNALIEGVFDMCTIPANYYGNRLPEAPTLILSKLTPMEEKKAGFQDLMLQLHKNVGLYYLGRGGKDLSFFLFTRMAVEKPADLKGKKFMASPTWVAPYAKLGISPVNVPGPELISAIQQGVVDGFAWAWRGMSDAGYHQAAKYCIFHPLFGSPSVTVMNLKSFNALPKNIQDLLIKINDDMQPDLEDWMHQAYAKEVPKWWDAGMKKIEFSPADAKSFTDTVYNSAWEQVISKSPTNGPKIKEMVDK